MNQANKIKTPPIRLFGNVVLLQHVKEDGAAIVLPTGSTAKTPRRTLFIAAIGDGEAVNHKGLAIGDEVECMHPPMNPEVSLREYNGVEYLLQGLDNIIGVRID